MGLLRERHTAVWRLHARPDRAYFVRVDRQHLVFTGQQMQPFGMPAEYAMDCTRFREYRVSGPLFPDSVGTTVSTESFAVSPTGAWFRRPRLQPGGVRFPDLNGATAWLARCFYQAVEVPGWSLDLLFSLVPLARLAAGRRRRTRARRGLCPQRGYDLRATPGRCRNVGRSPPSRWADEASTCA